ncbi:MAG: hypothetical protein IJV73_05855 [Clostridia bacterium]|nr:hypothetical protein [Clostridia bacterium]
MKWIRKYIYELLTSILGIAFATMLLYLLIVKPEDLIVRGTVMFGLFFDAIAIYYTLRKLWRTKWRQRVMPSVQKFLEKVARVLKLFRERLGIPERKHHTVLKGKSKIFFDVKATNVQTKRAKKPSAWKSLQTDRERLGYLYRRMIDTNIHQGLSVFSSETPTEIRNKKEYRDVENQIFDLYVENRYKNNVTLDRIVLDELKKEMKSTKD